MGTIHLKDQGIIIETLDGVGEWEPWTIFEGTWKGKFNFHTFPGSTEGLVSFSSLNVGTGKDTVFVRAMGTAPKSPRRVLSIRPITTCIQESPLWPSVKRLRII